MAQKGSYNICKPSLLGAIFQKIVWFDGLPVASLRPSVSGGGIEIFNISSDHLGTPRVIRRATDGVIVWRWDSDPFGVTSPNENPSGAGEFKFNLRFPGQYADAETGLNYNYFRDYNPKTGRYVQSDPIGLEGGVNTYAYAGGTPTNLADPTGECPWCIAAAVGALTDLSIQLYFNGFNLKCIDKTEVLISAAAAGLGVGLAQKLGTISTVHAGTARPTYRFVRLKNILRVEAHPISKAMPSWYNYPHWHPDILGKPWSKMHWPLVEPLVGVPSATYNATNKLCDGCEK